MAHKDQMMMLKVKDNEAEKSTFERFEQELKNTIFGVTFIMLKTEQESTWQLVVMMFIQACQLFSLVFNPSINFPWRGYTVTTYFQNFLQVFQIAYWCTFVEWVPYLIIFYAAVFIVILIIIDILYAVYTFTNKKIAAMWPLRLLRYALFFLVTILFMPFVYLFLSVMQCQTENGELVHYTFREVTCWKDLHILHAIFGILTCAIFVAISLVVVLTLFETKSISNDPAARIHSRNDFWQNIFKFVGIVLTTFFTEDDYRWVLTIYVLVGSVLLFIKAKNEKPYYQESVNRIMDVTNGLFMWACFCLLIVMVSKDSDFTGGMQAFIMVVPLVGIIVITRTSRRYYVLLKMIDDFDSPEEWFLKIRYYIELVQHKEANREAAVQLNGFMFHHEESCYNINCPIKSYTNTLIQSLKDKKKKQQRSSTESFGLLMSYAKQLFAQGVAKFPTSSSLHIAYALFLKDRMNDKSTAIGEFTAAEKNNPQFDEQFLIYRYRKILEDETMDVSENGGASMDVVTMLAYENCLQQCKEAIEKSAYLHMEFWLELLEPEPDLGKLDATGIRICATIAAVQEHWGKVRKINPNVPKALKLYADYLIEILNDAEEGTELLAKAKDNEVSKNNYLSNVVGDAASLGMGDICATMGGADGTPCVVASGEQGKLGEIMQFNMSSCRLFGYTKLEMLGKRINMLMPELYAKNHDAILQHGIENVEALGLNSSKSDKFVLGRHKSGYLLPLPLQARVVISINQGAFFVATFKSDKKGLNVTYLLLNDQQDVVGVSSRAIETLGLNNHILRNYRVSIQTLAPSVHDKTLITQFQSKNGGNLEFFKPDLSGDNDHSGAMTTLSRIGDNAGQIEAPGKKLRIKASKKSVKMNCIMTEVSFAGHPSGYIMRLEPIEDMKVPLGSLKMEKGQTTFQFAFDPLEMKYIQQNCDDDAQKLIAEEMSGYVNIMRDRSASSYSPIKSDESKDRVNTSAISVLPEANKGDDISRLQAALDSKRKAYAEGIDTYRLVDGRRERVEASRSRLLEKQQEEQRELEDLSGKESKGPGKREDAFSVLKSRKIFASTLNDRTTPVAVKNLRYAGYVMILVLVTIASTEFGLAVVQYRDIGENIDMIRDNYRQLVSQMTMVFYISKLVLLQQNGTLTSSLASKGKDRIESALTEYYSLQNSVSLSTLSLTSAHENLFKDKCVYLYYVNSSVDSSEDKYYTLPESVQQFASEVFTILSVSDSTKYVSTNDNIYFVLYNGFSDLYTKLKTSANFYVKELTDRGDDKLKVAIALFAVALAILAISMAVLFPIVASVSHTRLSVLTLFFDLPQATVRELQKKCERFVAQSKDEEVEGMSASESNACLGDTPAKTEAVIMATTQGSAHKRKYKNNKTSSTSFYIYFSVALLVIAGYFAVNFAFGYIYLKNVGGYSRELNATAVAHSESTHAVSIIQGLLGYGRIFTLTSAETFDYLALKEITDLYAIAQEMQISHNENARIFDEDYQTAFIDVMRNNICNFKTLFGLMDNCETFLEGTTKEGLHPVMVNFIENTREVLASYKAIMDQNVSDTNRSRQVTLKLYSSDEFADMETSIFDVANPALRYLVKALTSSHDSRASVDVRQRIILYVCFLFCFLVGYFALWSPFTWQLSNEIWRTRSMLTLIPYDVCKNVPSIKEYLSKQGQSEVVHG